MRGDELDRTIDRIRDKPTFAFQNVQNMSEASITLIILGIFTIMDGMCLILMKWNLNSRKGLKVDRILLETFNAD